MGKLSKILPVETHVQHIKRTLGIEMRNVRNFTTDRIALVSTFNTSPVLAILCLRLLFLAFINDNLVVLKTHSNAVHIFQDRLSDRHVQL